MYLSYRSMNNNYLLMLRCELISEFLSSNGCVCWSREVTRARQLEESTHKQVEWMHVTGAKQQINKFRGRKTLHNTAGFTHQIAHISRFEYLAVGNI